MTTRRSILKGFAGVAAGLILPPSLVANAEAARRYWALDRTMVRPPVFSPSWAIEWEGKLWIIGDATVLTQAGDTFSFAFGSRFEPFCITFYRADGGPDLVLYEGEVPDVGMPLRLMAPFDGTALTSSCP